MTLYETIDLLKKIALKHPNIGSASEGNIYEYMNANPSVKYGVFFITQGTHSQDEMFNHFEFTLFYVDRLVDDMEENRLQIQSIGKEILSNILTFFCEEFDAECENISFQPFTQKFVDMTAGIYSTITIDVPKDVICPEEYWKEDWKTPVIVIHNEDKRVVFTENGTYTIDYDPNTYTGLGTVEVNVNIDVDSYYNNGYNQGKTDGISEQKSKLESINITENGTYTKEDGYSHIEVNVPDLNGSYDEGYAEGERVGYGQGKTDGIDEQKSKLERIEITENGTYTKEDGYNHIEVNVPDLNGSYDEGYAEGERVGYDQGKTDVVANARDIEVTKNGQYGDGETLYKNINVNVVPKINVKETGIKFGKSIFTEVPEWADFKGIINMNNMFYECIYLKAIPLIDTSNVTDMSYMFYDCRSLQTIPLLDTSNVKYMEYMFGYCNFQTIPLLNTSNVTTMENMFFNCSNLQTIPQIDTSNVTNMTSMFSSCTSLVSIPALNAQKLSMNRYSGIFGYVSLSKLTDFGGFLNLKCSLESNYNFKSLPNLTYESCINVLNGLYDFTGNGETPNSNQGKLKVHPNFLTTVGDEISIGTSRGWTITA